MDQVRAFFARVRHLFSRAAPEEPREIATPRAEAIDESAAAPLVEPLPQPISEGPVAVETAPEEPSILEPTTEHVLEEPAVPVPVLTEPEPEEVAVYEPPAENAVEEATSVAVEAPPVETEPEPAPVEAPRPDALVLRLVSERDAGRAFEVLRSGATVGRGPENTIRLEDLSVSRRHARIVYRQGAYWISDIGSVGGTWVNAKKLDAPRQIEAGQTIDIGVYRLAVEATPDTTGATGKSRPARSASGPKRVARDS